MRMSWFEEMRGYKEICPAFCQWQFYLGAIPLSIAPSFITRFNISGKLSKDGFLWLSFLAPFYGFSVYSECSSALRRWSSCLSMYRNPRSGAAPRALRVSFQEVKLAHLPSIVIKQRHQEGRWPCGPTVSVPLSHFQSWVCPSCPDSVQAWPAYEMTPAYLLSSYCCSITSQSYQRWKAPWISREGQDTDGWEEDSVFY